MIKIIDMTVQDERIKKLKSLLNVRVIIVHMILNNTQGEARINEM